LLIPEQNGDDEAEYHNGLGQRHEDDAFAEHLRVFGCRADCGRASTRLRYPCSHSG